MPTRIGRDRKSRALLEVVVISLRVVIELHAGKLTETRRYLKQSIVASQELYMLAFVAQSLESFAYLDQAEYQPQRAARLLGAAEAIQEKLGTSAVAIHRLEHAYESADAWLQAELDEAARRSLWSEGHRMSTVQAVAYPIEE